MPGLVVGDSVIATRSLAGNIRARATLRRCVNLRNAEGGYWRWGRLVLVRRLDSPFPRFLCLVELRLAVAEPCGRPDTVEAPTFTLQHLLPKAVAVAGRVRGVIAGAIGLDSEHHPSGLVRMRTGEVDAITGDAVLGRNRDTAAVKSILDRKFEWVERNIANVRTEVVSAGSSILEVLPEQFDTLRWRSGPGPYRDG